MGLKVLGIVLFIAVFAFIGIFVRGASFGKPEWYQNELDDEQMRTVSKNNQNKAD